MNYDVHTARDEISIHSLSPYTLSQPCHLKITIMEELHPVNVFLNSRAMGNFIHEELVQKLKLPVTPQPKPLNLHVIQGSKFHQVTTQCTMKLPHNVNTHNTSH